MRLDHLLHDVRHGFRLFSKSPAFAAVAVLSIACGTGANVAMFSTADALLLRPLPILNANELIAIGTPIRSEVASFPAMSYPDFEDLRRETRAFRALVAYTSDPAGVSVSPVGPRQVRFVTAVSGNFFNEFGIGMRLGRGFRLDEDQVPGRNPVTVISHGMWQELFESDPSVIGRDLFIAGVPFTIIGVAAESFEGIYTFPIRVSAYVPLAMWPRIANSPDVNPLRARDLRAVWVKGRLRAGVGLAKARAELDAFGRNLERAFPQTNAGRPLIAMTEFEFRVARSPLEAGTILILSVLAMAVLGVACANVAGLLTSRAPLRARELAVRQAIGASRGRLVMQLLTECAGIALAGGVAGLGVGYAGIRIIDQIQLPTDMIARPELQLDQRALLFSMAMALASVFLFGLGPALTTTKIDISNSFRASDPGGQRRWRMGGRNTLVAVQVALSLTVLTVAALTYQTFVATFGNGPGFRTSQLAKINVNAAEVGYREARAVDLYERLLDDVRRLPGVSSASVASAMPLASAEGMPIVLQSIDRPIREQTLSPWVNAVDERYFDTMEIPLVSGRRFTVSDVRTSPLVAIVNHSMARHYWQGADGAIGRRFRLKDQGGPIVEIVGVAADSLYLYPAEPPQDVVYVPFRQQSRPNMVVLAQTTGPSAGPLKQMREIVRAIDPSIPVFDVQTMETFYAGSATTIANVVMSMVTGIGVMGVTITVIGLYGLVSFAVSRRTREIGIRIAMGATYARVLRMLLRQGLAPVWIGLAIGLALSVAAGRTLPSLVSFSAVYDTRLALMVLIPTLLFVTLAAAFVPANRAATISPMVALRDE